MHSIGTTMDLLCPEENMQMRADEGNIQLRADEGNIQLRVDEKNMQIRMDVEDSLESPHNLELPQQNYYSY